MDNIQHVEAALAKIDDRITEALAKANEEARIAKSLSQETKAELTALGEELKSTLGKMRDLEQKLAEQNLASGKSDLSVSERVIQSANFQAFLQTPNRAYSETFAITAGGGTNRPLVQPDRDLANVHNYGFREFKLRDIVTVLNTNRDVYEYVRQSTVTDNSGVQYSSGNYENVTVGTSDLLFTLHSTPVVNVSHLMELSEQILADSPLIQSYVDMMLRYLADKKIEDQMISGNGTGQLSGILTSGNYTAYTRAVTGDDNLQTIRRALTQLKLSDYNADAIVVSPATWEKLELLEDSNGRPVLIGVNQGAGSVRAATLYGRPVIESNAMTDSYALVGNFKQACHLVDRNQTTVQIAYEHSSNFAKHMVAMRASHRLAFAVVAPKAIIRVPIV